MILTYVDHDSNHHLNTYPPAIKHMKMENNYTIYRWFSSQNLHIYGGISSQPCLIYPVIVGLPLKNGDFPAILVITGG